MAYLRTLALGNPSKADAENVYASGAGDDKILQDYIFSLHRHRMRAVWAWPCTSTPCSRWRRIFQCRVGANPMLLEPLFNDPALRKTNFVHAARRLAIRQAIDRFAH